MCRRYRGEGVVCGTLEDVWDCVRPAEGGLRVKWDENVTGFEVIEKITDVSFSQCGLRTLWLGVCPAHMDLGVVPWTRASCAPCASERPRNPRQSPGEAG